MPKVLYYLQHLLGIGHVRRSALIITHLCQEGFEVHVAFGGLPVPHIGFDRAIVHQLTPLRSSNERFAGLVTGGGEKLSEEIKTGRSKELLRLASALHPDIIVTETYPFGRHMMRFELDRLLLWTHEQVVRPMVVSSIRDILQRRRAEREQEAVDKIHAFYDLVLVHGDPAFLPLERSFPPAGDISAKCAYTGYVCAEPSFPSGKRHGVVVSIGGGAVGVSLLRAAVEVFRSGFMNDRPWTLLAGVNLPDRHFTRLQTSATDNLNILRHAADLQHRLANAELSVSMAGYNTVMDMLQSHVPAVVVPFEGAGESEQLMRAERLAECGRVTVVRESQLTPANLRRAMMKTMARQTEQPAIATDGARLSAKLLREWWQRHG